jgi:hypothetical protein
MLRGRASIDWETLRCLLKYDWETLRCSLFHGGAAEMVTYVKNVENWTYSKKVVLGRNGAPVAAVSPAHSCHAEHHSHLLKSGHGSSSTATVPTTASMVS